MRSRALGVGPADHDELLTVQAFDLSPEAAVAGLVGAVQPFRDDALDPELAGIAIKALSTHNMMFAVLQPGGALASNASRRSFLTRSGSPVRSSPSKKRRSNSTRTSPSVLRASVAACMALNEVRPCSESAQSSPSIYAWLTGSARRPLTMAGYFSVQSSPVRVRRRTFRASMRACIRSPSHFSSWAHSPPLGAVSVSAVSCGGT